MDGEQLPGLELEVHPLADIFPMLGEDELADLAADIEANGQQVPIMLDAAGKLIVDGRNRLAACKIAGVEPWFDQLKEGEEPAAFIVSANLQRRHMTAGQRAMALAMIYPEAAKLRRSGLSVTERQNVTAERLSLARLVLRYGPDDLAPEVLAGSRSLDDAYTEAKKRRDDRETKDDKMATLRAEAPEIADLVTEGTLTLAAGIIELEQRKAEAAAIELNKRETMLRLAEGAYRTTTAWASENLVKDIRARLGDPEFRQQLIERVRLDGSLENVRVGAAALIDLLGELDK
jgi:ParB-like chromosome segregation protein Spo0J